MVNEGFRLFSSTFLSPHYASHSRNLRHWPFFNTPHTPRYSMYSSHHASNLSTPEVLNSNVSLPLDRLLARAITRHNWPECML